MKQENPKILMEGAAQAGWSLGPVLHETGFLVCLVTDSAFQLTVLVEDSSKLLKPTRSSNISVTLSLTGKHPDVSDEPLLPSTRNTKIFV